MTLFRTRIDQPIEKLSLVILAKRMRKLVTDKNNLFSMNYWEDERTARKEIRENMELIVQRAKADGKKCFMRKNAKHTTKDTIEIQFADTAQFLKRDGTVEVRHDFTGQNAIKITWDATKKFRSTKHETEDSGKKRREEK